MKKIETQTLYNSITNIEDKYIQEAQAAKRRKKSVWPKWTAAAAYLSLICVSAITLSNILKNEPAPDNGLTTLPGLVQPPTADSEQLAEDQEIFVPITSLLTSENHGIREALTLSKDDMIPIGQYTGVYERVQSAESTVLSESRGSSVAGAGEWYYVSGHTDMQYLIRNDNEKYSLWKFSYFDNEEYPYCDVLELVYQIYSADVISEIDVKHARMDNTDEGKAIQEKIGTYIIKNREEIETIYQILSSLTCYGSNHWDMIDYGEVEAPADPAISSHQAILLGRYLSIVTDYGNVIDGLKYTAVSDMFYEFSGIAYNRLTAEQAKSIYEIFRISENVEELQNREIAENNEFFEGPSEEHKSEILLEAKNAGVTLEDITELQNRVSAAMINGELPFVTESAVYENPYRLHVVVTTNSESDIQKLKELDSLGGALEIEYLPANNNIMEKR